MQSQKEERGRRHEVRCTTSPFRLVVILEESSERPFLLVDADKDRIENATGTFNLIQWSHEIGSLCPFIGTLKRILISDPSWRERERERSGIRRDGEGKEKEIRRNLLLPVSTAFMKIPSLAKS
jgi:hypothetical protein